MRLQIAVLVGVVLVTYHNSLDCGFVFDDVSAIKDNVDLRPTTPLGNLFYNDFWGTPMKKEQSHKSYRPLTVLTFRFNYLLHKLDAMGYHLVNVVLHTLVAVQIYTLFKEVLEYTQLVSFLSSLLFAVHPIHTEAVTGVVGRAELLATLLGIAAFYIHLKHLKSSRFDIFYYILTSLLILAATLSKEQGITVAGICILYDVVITQQLSLYELLDLARQLVSLRFSQIASKFGSCIVRSIALVLTTALILALRIYVMGSQLPAFTNFDNPASTQTTPYRHLTYNYLLPVNSWLLLVPASLCCDWTMGTIPVIRSLFDWRNLLTLVWYLGFFKLLYFSLSARTQIRDQVFTAIIFLVLPFLPASNLFFPVGFVVAERVLYIPSIGYCLLLAVAVQLIYSQYQSKLVKYGAVLSLGLLIVSGCIRTYTRNKDWVNDYTLFMSGLKFTRNNAKIWNNVGHALESEGRLEEALMYFNNASMVQPDDIGSHVNVGRTLKSLGEYQKAEQTYAKALELLPPVIPGQPYTARIAPSHLNVFISLANLLSQNSSRSSEVESLYKRVISMRADFVQAYMNYGEYLVRHNRSTEAIEQYNIALNYDRTNADLFYNLGVVYLERKQMQKALNYFNLALNVDSNHKQALFNSAMMMQESGQSALYEEAEGRINRLIDLEPDNDRALFTAAMIATDRKNFKKAKDHFEKALKANPSSKVSLFNLALLLSNDMGLPNESIPYLKKCIELYPDHTKSYLLLGDIAINYLKNLELAEKSFSEVLTYEPRNVQARHNLCVVYAERGDLKKAESCLIIVNNLAPNEEYIRQHLSIIRNKLTKSNG